MELKTLFKDTADAIREKDGTTEPILARDFPARIQAIQGGGGGVTMERIEIKAPPDKVRYKIGESFDPTGMSVWASFSNGYGLYVNLSDLTFGPAGPLDEGTEAVTVRFRWGGETASATQTINVSRIQIYGVEWDGTSTTKWTRTDDAAGFADPNPAVKNGDGSSPFDGLQPWAGMVKVEDSEAGMLVAIPKFWYKWTKNGNSLKLQIADGQTDGFNVSPAHADRGDGKGERDVVYVGRYHCASGFKSATGAAQQVSISRSTARNNIHKLGATIWQLDYAMRVTIQMLYLVEFADWNSQAKIGYGGSSARSKVNNGQTDAMQYHTGTTAKNRTTYGFTQYRNIEGLWDNVYNWMDGCYYDSNGMNIIMNPNNFSDASGGTLIGKPSNGSPSAIAVSTVSGLEWAIYPTAADGSDSTHISDDWGFSVSSPCLICGGDDSQVQSRGLFFVSYKSASNTGANIGCRLMKLPDAA